MSKNVLLVYYTQSGQLEEIANNLVSSFGSAGITVEPVRVRPEKDFPFPWTTPVFFEAMPESVHGVPVPLEPLRFKSGSYDLVIFAYQPWFLSPSIPSNSVLLDPAFRAVIKNTPVLTLIGARNMWLNAQETVKNELKSSGATLVGNIALVDRVSNLVSVVTIFHWMLSGRKDRYLNIFPKPGVSDEDILAAKDYGKIVAKAIDANAYGDLQKELVKAGAVEVKYNLMFVENTGKKIFRVWAKIISSRKNRSRWLVIFKYYLLFALFIVSPLVLLINNIFFRPFKGKQNRKKINYYLGLNQ